MLEHHDQPVTLILKIISLDGKKVSSSEDILETFTQYYSSLFYSCPPADFHPGDLSILMDQMALNWLSDRERETLVLPITPEEVIKIIQSFLSGKALGPYGLPIEFYKINAESVAPILAELYAW